MAQVIYKKSTVPLRGGLDLVSPRFAVTPGTLQDCLNYETYGVAGYSVMEGLERYDGVFPCYNKDWVVATRSTGSGDFSIGEYLKIGDNYVGVTIGWDSVNGILSYLILNPPFAPRVGDTIIGSSLAAPTLVAAVGDIKRASNYYSDEATFLEAQRVIYEACQPLKKSIYPYISYAKNVIPHGLHWYRGSVFAVADAYQVAFTTGTFVVNPGDLVNRGGGSTFEGTVMSVNVTSGSWSDGTAAGTMVIRTDGDLTTNAVATGLKDTLTPNGATLFTTHTSAFTVTDVQVANSPTAQLYRGPLDDDYQTTAQINANSSRALKVWEPVDMGWEIPFKTNDTTTGAAPQTVFRGNTTATLYTSIKNTSTVATTEVLSAGATLTHPLGGISVTNPAATALHTVLGDATNTSYVSPGQVNSPSHISTLSASLTGFNTALAGIPDAAIITGIELTAVTSSTVSASGTAVFSLVGSHLTPGTPDIKTITIPTNQSSVTTVIGNSADLWGFPLSAANLLAAIRDDSTFGVSFYMTQDAVTGSAQRIFLQEVSLKVYYKVPITAYYAHDPVSGQDLQIGIPYLRLLTGQFNPGVSQVLWGQGSMSIYNITPRDSTSTPSSAVSSTTYTIGTGWQLRTLPNGGGDLIAIFTAQMNAAQLPPRAKMEAVRKRFEIITANYYANSDWVAMYGVDGVGPSWQYDGYYFYNVYTALSPTEDTPSHICYHRNYAVLGYENGQCIVSFPGQPTNFDPVAGSTLYPFGERITGLLSLNGTALGVLCESSIHALAGDILTATDDNNAVSQVISPYSGAIEYTVKDCGIPLFMDFRGISTIDATNKYGDFENGRVSYQITPYLSNRINDRFSYQATTTNVLFTEIFRNKNQLRTYFEDGSILTCGLPTGDRGYEFTTQQYVSSAYLDSMVPVAMCSGTTKAGRDVVFGTFKLLPQDDTNIVTPDANDREMFVYAVDKGTRFDLAPIKHFVRLNYMNIDDPNTNDAVRKLRLEVLTNHYFNEYVSASVDYQTPTNARRQLVIDPTGLPIRIVKDSDYLIVSIETVGTTTALEFGGEHIYPGHVLQAMQVYTMEGKDQLGNSPNQKLT